MPPASRAGPTSTSVCFHSLGARTVGAGLSIAQLLQARRENGRPGLAFLRTFPSSTVLENLAYRVVVVGVAFWTFTLIACAIWAERSWGRYWNWDPKEVWTFVIWVVYAGYLHARATAGWRGGGAAWVSSVGFAVMLFNLFFVNLVTTGLHSYAGVS